MAAAVGELRPAERGLANCGREGPAEAKVTPVEEIEAVHARLAATFRTGRTKSYEWRVAQLQGVRRLCFENEERIIGALGSDLGRPKMEAFLGDVAAVVQEIDHTLAHLKSWMSPQVVPTPLLQKPGHSAVIREPKGVALVMAPWNFPFTLSIGGLCSVVAAGNCCVLKPSEIAPATEQLVRELLPRYVDSDGIAVVTGGVPEATALLKLRWDHIFYTGNGAVARVVARAAAEHLTPVTLELGGKSPTVVLPGANIPIAAKRILAGKTFNAGQICVSPDYALVHESVEEALVKEMRATLRSWYGEDASTSDSFGRIVNHNHFRRVKSLLDSADGEVLKDHGSPDEASKFIPPTLVRGPSKTSPIMQEEIFGPLLPVLKCKSVDEIVEHINAGEKPLALYIFGTEADANTVIARTSSGGVCVNDTIFHIATPELPFGGVGGSGMGRCHGKWGFDEFSHQRGVLWKATWIDAAQRYPPYNEANLSMMKKLMIGPLLPPAARKAALGLLGIAVSSIAFAVRRLFF